MPLVSLYKFFFLKCKQELLSNPDFTLHHSDLYCSNVKRRSITMRGRIGRSIGMVLCCVRVYVFGYMPLVMMMMVIIIIK